MGLNSLFGGAPVETGQTEQREDGEYVDGYRVATAEDMEWFAKLL